MFGKSLIRCLEGLVGKKPQHFKTIYSEITLDSQKSCKNSTENSLIPFAQLLFLLMPDITREDLQKLRALRQSY